LIALKKDAIYGNRIFEKSYKFAFRGIGKAELVKAYRLDFGRFDAPEKTSQGYLKANAYVTRIGVFKYLLPNGSVRKELRPPDEVFDHNSLNSLSEVPVTNDHPPQMLDTRNTKKYAVGWTSRNVEKEASFVRTGVTITDQDTIDEIASGKKQETSCGYTCALDENPGEWEGEEYDAVQRDIVYNHVAVVEQGRAGPSVRVHMDSFNHNHEYFPAVMVRQDSEDARYDGLEETENEVRARIKSPSLFDPESLRTKELPGGISIIIGNLKNPPAGKEGSMVVQAYRFKKGEGWTMEKAKSWLSEHDLTVTDVQWTAAFINNLPDAAFAHIEGGGDKDEAGNTVPRSLRHFPHHNGSVKSGTDNETVDLPHLRNALARVEQSPFGKNALPHLVAHAKALKIGEYAESTDTQEDNMVKVTLAGKEFDASEELAKAIAESEKAHADTAAKLSEIEKSAEGLKAKADAYEADLKKTSDELNAMKAEKQAEKEKKDRADLLEVAKKFIPEDVAKKLDDEKADLMAIRKAAIASASPDFKFDGKSDEYLTVRFDIMVEQAGDKGDGVSDALKKHAKGDGNSSEFDEVAARKKAMERSQNAWKVGLETK
jgi:hypothetical protein